MDVLMPQLGETVSEGKILVWYKAVGDTVEAGENLFEIETEKVSMEVPAIAAGVLSEIRVAVDETAPVGAVVAVISESGAHAGSTEPAAATHAAAPFTVAGPASAPVVGAASHYPGHKLEPFCEVRTPPRNYGPARLDSGVTTTPLARRLAASVGLDLSGLRGSGPDGRIVAKDIEVPGGSTAQTRSSVPERPAAPPAAMAEHVKALYEPGSYVEQPLDGMRRAIARRLTESKQTIPHFYVTADLEVDALMSLREQLNAGAPQRDGKAEFRLTVNDLLIGMWAAALQRVPRANAVWAEDRILQFARSDIGVAIAVEQGLFTPVIRGADKKTWKEISAQMQDFTARARARKLKAHELQGGVSALSNLGMFGVREFAAIVNPPHSTILAVGGTQRRALEAPAGGVRFASLMTVTLSCDHRVIDGALGAELLAALRELVGHAVRDGPGTC